MNFYYINSRGNHEQININSITSPRIIKIKNKLFNQYYFNLNKLNNKYLYDIHWFNYSKNILLFESSVFNLFIYCRINNINEIYTESISSHIYYDIAKILNIKIYSSYNFLSLYLLSISKLKHFIFNFFLLCFSIFSILIFSLQKNQNFIGIWTGDFVSQKNKCDPRVNNLYEVFFKNQIKYIEFIRTSSTSYQTTFLNLLKRRRLAIYYDSIIYFINLFSVYKSNKLFDYLLFRNNAPSNNFIIIKIYEYIFSILRVNKFIPWFSSSRTIHLIAAAHSKKIITFGFMHGLSFIHNMKHEYMHEYRGILFPKINFFGVYSSFFKNEIETKSSLYDKVEISGPLSYSESIYNSIKPCNCKYNTLFISETHSNPQELIHFYDLYLSCNEFLYLKIRNFTNDLFYEKLKKIKYKNINKIIPVTTPSPICFENFSIVVGSHSTLLAEASAANRKVFVISTSSYKDFFSLLEDSYLSYQLVRTPEEFISKIYSHNLFHPDKFSNKFFPKISGAKWIEKKLIS